MGQTMAVVAEGLVKCFGRTRALDGLDLQAEAGTVLCVLGPNGAGKTTAVRILTTLLAPDAGHATVDGLDVVRDAELLRGRIGLAGQYAAVDEYLTGRENIELFGRLYHLPKSAARARAEQLLVEFDLADAGGRPVKTYSGGMRRRLDLAASLIVSPAVLFLDEPTTGLDPRGRLSMWAVIEGLIAQGTTLLLTTQYLEEADRLASSIAVVDGGKVIASGTSDELKNQVGGDRLEVVALPDADLSAAARVLRPHLSGEPTIDADVRRISGPIASGTAELASVVRDLDEAGVGIGDLSLRRPTLDDVFLALTGHVVDETAEQASQTDTARSKEPV